MIVRPISMTTSAFTCTGAYAVLIMSGLKRVENRSAMPVPAKGRCAMSVSKKFCRAEYDNLIAWLAVNCGAAVKERVLPWDEVKSWPGCIVGTMDYEAFAYVPADAAMARECRIWNEGYGNWWILSGIRRLSVPVPCRGNVGMWRLDDMLARQVDV